MYNTLHTRLLAEVLAEAEGVALPAAARRSPTTTGRTAGCTTSRSATSATSWSPRSTTASPRPAPRASPGCSSTCGKPTASGPEFARQELDEIGALLGRPFDDVEPARQAVCTAIEQGALTADAVLPYCLAPGRA